MKFEMNNKVYDVLKWLVVVVLPACSVLYAGLAKAWGFGYVTEVVTTITAVELLIGVSTASYNKSLEESTSKSKVK